MLRMCVATEEVPLAGSDGATIEGGLKGVAPIVLDGGALEGILDLTQGSQASTVLDHIL